MQQAISELEKLGPLPSSKSRDLTILKKYQELIASIRPPVTDEDARALVRLFGPDECFGLAWSMLHLVESAPGWPLVDCLEGSDNEWIVRLRQRATEKK